MNVAQPTYASYDFTLRPRPTLPECRRHWLRGILAGLLIAGLGLLLVKLLDRWLTASTMAAPLHAQLSAETLTIEQDGTYKSHESYRSHPIEIDAGGPLNHQEAIAVDLPSAQHQSNISVMGLGCCVFRSLDHAARYQQVAALIHMPEWMREKGIAGGGYPEKVAKLIPQCAKDRGLPVPAYVQHTGGDMQFLRLALSTGSMVCVTYDGHDGVYYRGSISHMVNLVHLSDKWAVILDNNNPGKYLWMTPSEFESRWKGDGGGWAVVLLAPPPPPVPVN